MITQYLLPGLRRAGGRGAGRRRRRHGRRHDRDARRARGRARRIAGRRPRARGTLAGRARRRPHHPRGDDVPRRRLRARPHPRAVVRGRRGRRSGASQHGHRGRQPRSGRRRRRGAARARRRGRARRAPCPWTTSGPRSSRAIVLGLVRGRPDSVFLRWARRAANSPAVVSVAVSRPRGAGRRRPAPGPLAGAEAGDPGAAAAEIDPPTDEVASAWYRRRMTELFVRRALEARDAV